MPVPAMARPMVDHQRRFQAAVDVIHNLPKNGSYRPSYEVMLRFYSLYKQAVYGPCTVPRPGFWDPVGRYKWDAWSCLGQMSSNSAMEAYVDEMKKVAQEVIDTMPMNEKTASFFHHFEPLYLVIDDMPRPPDSLFSLTAGLKSTDCGDHQANHEEKQDGPQEKPDEPHQDQEVNASEDVPANSVSNDPLVSEGLALTSDSESEIYCDSVDSVEQLTNILIPIINGDCSSCHTFCKLPSVVAQPLEGRQVGAGQGGEGAEDEKGSGPSRRGQDTGREGSYHSRREHGVPQGSSRWEAPGACNGAGRRGGDGSEDGAERLHDIHLQQQIILALQRLRDDMRSVMDRLEVVERLAAAQGQQWRPCLQCAASQQQDRWRPFDLAAPTFLLFLLWPFAAQGLVFLLRRARHSRTSS